MDKSGIDEVTDMDEHMAIARLQEHFRIHDDGRPTPLLDEACVTAYQALGNQKWLREKLIEYEKNPTAAGGQGLINDMYKVFVFGWKDANFRGLNKN